MQARGGVVSDKVAAVVDADIASWVTCWSVAGEQCAGRP